MANFENQAIYPAAELFLLNQFMLQEGFLPKQWLLGTGLTDAQINQPETLVSLRQYDIIHRNIFRLVARPDIGLALGGALNLSRWGVLTTALICAQTLGHALQTAHEFRTLVRSRFTLTTHLRGDQVEVRLQRREDMQFPLNAVFTHEVLLGSLQRQISELLAEPFSFTEVRLNYPPPAHQALYQAHLGCPVQFNSEQSCLVIPLTLMTRALPLWNPVTEYQARAVCKQEVQRLAQAQGGDFRWLARAEIARHEGSLPSLEEVAQRLQVTSRTLRRRLQERGTSYRHLCQEHQLQLALELLMDRRLSIARVASRCGFRDAASFREAFRRWTDLTPQQYRQEQRGPRNLG